MANPGVLLDEEGLQHYILLKLGAPQVKVELVQEDLDMAVAEAKRWFAAKKGFKRQTRLYIDANSTEIELPDDVGTVIDVSPASRLTDFARVIDPMGLLDQSIPYNLFPAPKTSGLFSTYAQSLMYLEMAKRVTGGEFEWRQDGRILSLFPAQREAGTIIIDYMSGTITLTDLAERDHDLVKRFALADAMDKLSRVRGKYDAVLTAQGQTGIDGMRLKQEADALKAGLNNEIAQSGFPMGLLTG